MDKDYKRIEMGDLLVKHKVLLKDTVQVDEGPLKEFRRYAFLQEMITDGVYNGQTLCGPAHFDTAKISFVGGYWQAELEYIEKGVPDGF